jgi:hypothetical protein
MTDREEAIRRWRKAYTDKGMKLPDRSETISFLRTGNAPRLIVPLTEAPVDQILADAQLMEDCNGLDDYKEAVMRQRDRLIARR